MIICRRENMPLFSVIVPVYNTAPYLRECLDSLCCGKDGDAEILAVDDGSSDGSADILYEYAARFSDFYTVSQHNGGVAKARNNGLERVKGKYILFVDSDDSLVPGALERLRLFVENEEHDIIEFDSVSFDDRIPLSKRVFSRPQRGHYSGNVEGNGQFIFSEWIRTFFFRTTAYLRMYSADFLRKTGIRFLEGVCFEDVDWTPRVFRYAQKVKYLPEVLYRRRLFRRGSLMNSCRTIFNPKGCRDLFFMTDSLCALSGEKDISPSFSLALRQRAASVFLFSCFLIWTKADAFQRSEFEDDIRTRWHLAAISPNRAWRMLHRLSPLAGLDNVRRIYLLRNALRQLFADDKKTE